MKHRVLFVIAAVKLFLAAGENFFGGVVLPTEISIAVDESIFIKIKHPLQEQNECIFQAPGKKELNPTDLFVKFSDDKCGIRIDKVQKTHEGVWKLISSFKNATYEKSIKGTSLVYVKERLVVPPADNRIFASTENFAPTLQGYNLSYCYVSRDLGLSRMSEIYKEKCMIPQGLESDFRDGKWTVRMGVLGESAEVSFAVNIKSTGEIVTLKFYLTRPCRVAI